MCDKRFNASRVPTPVLLGLAVAALTCAAGAASASLISLTPLSDGTALDRGSDGSFDSLDTTDPNGILARDLGSISTERALADFTIPMYPQYTYAATFSGYINLTQGPSGRPIAAAIIAFPDDGKLTLDDATASASASTAPKARSPRPGST